MQWQSLLCPQRCGGDGQFDNDAGRTPFHKDQDRVIFSSAFRRLDRKTQVHPLSENDHIHTRLTHSLEASCVGRSLGARVGELLAAELPAGVSPADMGAIVQAACLAHDIGNPPFGHTGEDAIRQWFRDPKNQHFLQGLNPHEQEDLKCFEGNAQGLRVLTQLEYHRFEGGMRLTYATLGAFLKYPWTSADAKTPKGEKFGANQTELKILQDIAEKVGLHKIAENKYCRHPLVYLVEAADDICYAIIDLEDGIEMNLIRYAELEALLLNLIGDDVPAAYGEMGESEPARRRLAMLRGRAMDVLVNAVSQAFFTQREKLLAGTLEKDLFHYCAPHISEAIETAKQLARRKIFNNPSKAMIEIGAYTTLGSLLDAFLTAAAEAVRGEVSFRSQRILDLIGRHAPQPGWDLYHAYMRVIDYIAGMTDDYAVDMAQAIRGLRRS